MLCQLIPSALYSSYKEAQLDVTTILGASKKKIIGLKGFKESDASFSKTNCSSINMPSFFSDAEENRTGTSAQLQSQGTAWHFTILGAAIFKIALQIAGLVLFGKNNHF